MFKRSISSMGQEERSRVGLTHEHSFFPLIFSLQTTNVFDYYYENSNNIIIAIISNPLNRNNIGGCM